ncbi:glycosyltransferase [Patescibacteria group bacterium]|nr:glycosyltransferase [Patescibacteria group bacterium]
MDQVKLALVHDFLFAYGGAERTLHALHELYPEAPIYTTFAYPEIVAAHFPKAAIITSPLQKHWLRQWPSLLINHMPQAVESFDLRGYDVVLSSSGAFSHGVITGPDTVHICYCHTPMRYGWDWHVEYLSERKVRNLPALLIANTAMSRLRLWDSLSAKRVDYWVANSQVVANRIRQYYRAESEIIHPPVNTEFFDFRSLGEIKEGTCAITVSRLKPYKKIDLIIQACRAVGLPLKIAGAGEDEPRLRKLAGSDGTVIFLGPISEEEKRTEIAGSRCFIFPADDDFGIAPVEALGLGVPVIAYKKGGALEYVKDSENGYFFKEQTVESLEEQLRRFVTDGVRMNRSDIRETAVSFGEAAFCQNITSFITSHAHAN